LICTGAQPRIITQRNLISARILLFIKHSGPATHGYLGDSRRCQHENSTKKVYLFTWIAALMYTWSYLF